MMTEYVLHIGGTIEQAGKVLSRDGDVLTVELDDGRVITRHALNFKPIDGWGPVPDIEIVEEAPRKRGRPKKSIAG